MAEAYDLANQNLCYSQLLLNVEKAGEQDQEGSEEVGDSEPVTNMTARAVKALKALGGHLSREPSDNLNRKTIIYEEKAWTNKPNNA